MPGAPRLCVEACARMGAGVTMLATHPSHAILLVLMRPEIICQGISQSVELLPLIHRASVLAIGPGLTDDEWSRPLLTRLLRANLPTVIDAGALDVIKPLVGPHPNWIITPHPGEAARLLDTTAEEIQANRIEAVHRLQKKYGGVVVLKGAQTLIDDGKNRYVCRAGNPGMASGGMGDLLTGMIVGLLAQKLDPSSAACLGVTLHATAGDLAAKDQGERGLLALDLIPYARKLLNGLDV